MSHSPKVYEDEDGPFDSDLSSSIAIPLTDMRSDSVSKPRSAETSPLLDPYRVSDVTELDLGAGYNTATNEPISDKAQLHTLSLSSTALLILNKMIGTGVFSTPSGIYQLTGSVGISLVLWVLGGVLAFTGLSVYLDFGLRIPKSGGEKNYLERVYRKPRFLSTVIFGTEIVMTGFSAGNAYAFGKYILYAVGLEDPSDGAVRSVACLAVTFACLLHATAPRLSTRLSNILGVFKVLVLVLIVFSGALAALNFVDIPDKPHNFSNLWEIDHTVSPGLSGSPYALAIALLRVAYSYKGWENANYVLGHVKNPSYTLPRAGTAAISIVTVLYFLCNLAYFAVIPKTDIANSGVIVAGEFFTRVYGHSLAARALPFFVSLSNIGNVLAVSYAHGIVNYEVAKDHILPFTSFWTSLKPFGTPAAAFLLHWLITVVVLVLPPAGEVYEIIIDMYTYPGTIINIFVAAGLLYLHANPLENWSRDKYSSPMIVTLVFLVLQLFMTFFPMIPPPQHNGQLPYYAVPLLGWLVVLFGFVYFAVWRKTERPNLLAAKVKQEEMGELEEQ
ncbi:amino acid permease-domain-containing protein [Yarrowia lipolytica]|uniref:Amino acid permease-domain-containing protein n=1 Tax=Yarrowia lipolytica TaxID=4952 RepID=A0A371CG15_YARLL|nr:amino acid permease-domain-containing protein [Yarrowia lipolytica]RDW30847.1 amino acid permease-domain-containing protein [Yarrowia lipolytica]RDW42539.1 amino acid permease-domain-containing protein [Yarrowia lipolytica]RDW47422.1 amino acid permease-domain-containing protein [Yarrowia lipolytica]RDW53749.1 amino acid permease-domain-containing protein [Yarrowia lipolytica]